MKSKSLFLLLFTFMVTNILGACSLTDEHSECIGSASIIGTATVLDGDTLVIHEYNDANILMVNKQKIRLAFIDAPEVRQQCERKDTHVQYPCGIEARDALHKLVQDKTVTCNKGKIDLYQRMLSECFVDDMSINQYMIKTGNAILYKGVKTYKQDEQQAKQDHVGIWASDFQEPWEYRKNKKLKQVRMRASSN